MPNPHQKDPAAQLVAASLLLSRTREPEAVAQAEPAIA